MSDQARFEHEVMQELWWTEINQDAAYIAAQEAKAEKRESKPEKEECNNGAYCR